MPRAFLIKKKVAPAHPMSPAHSPKLFSPICSMGSPVSSPISSTSSLSSVGSSSPRNDENVDHHQQPQSASKYCFESQGLDLSMKSLLKEQQTNKQTSGCMSSASSASAVSPSGSSYSEFGSFVSRYPYPGKFAKIAEFFRNSELAKLQAAAVAVASAGSKNENTLKQSSAIHGEAQQASAVGRMAPYSINWSEHFSVHQVNVLSPVTSSSGHSDDSGRGSESINEDSSSSPNTSAEKGASSQALKSNIGERFKCTECNKFYSTQSGLAKHLEHHCQSLIQKSFSCKHCEKVYVSLGALKMHIRTHTLPCKCKLCGKAFSRPWLLQGHIRTHTGEKPFSCQYCNRAFADRSNLRAHLQTHSAVKKYSCKTCSRTFSRMSLLLKHEDNGCVAAHALTALSVSGGHPAMMHYEAMAM